MRSPLFRHSFPAYQTDKRYSGYHSSHAPQCTTAENTWSNTVSRHAVGESRSALVLGFPPGGETNYNGMIRRGMIRAVPTSRKHHTGRRALFLEPRPMLGQRWQKAGATRSRRARRCKSTDLGIGIRYFARYGVSDKSPAPAWIARHSVCAPAPPSWDQAPEIGRHCPPVTSVRQVVIGSSGALAPPT